MKEVPDGYPVIILDHEPDEIKALSAAGADVALCGHTHDGQIFPANLLVRLVYDNSYGYKKIGDTDSIVTSGVGLFGPFMRVGTISEICNIKIKFTP
ncbi:MAG: metallophosphoesterase, partial [Lachnospiraceae bacterium]|nr:metallophosphoesterase [Lachnospiraceae bacterium]